MSTHCHLSTTTTRAPPHTTSHLPSTTITPITLSDLFLFSPTQMSTHYDQGPPTYHIPPSFHYHHPNYFILSIPILPHTHIPPPPPKPHYPQGAPPPTTSHLPSTTITPNCLV